MREVPTSDIERSYRAEEKSAERRPLNSHVIADQRPLTRALTATIVFSMGAIAIAFMVTFAWSHTVLAPSQAGIAMSINPTDMMTNYKGSLPIEQWEAI